MGDAPSKRKRLTEMSPSSKKGWCPPPPPPSSSSSHLSVVLQCSDLAQSFIHPLFPLSSLAYIVLQRVNPSSGGLHPIEAYAILPHVRGMAGPGTHHYAAREHRLEWIAGRPEAEGVRLCFVCNEGVT